jgi:hypothetical protein
MVMTAPDACTHAACLYVRSGLAGIRGQAGITPAARCPRAAALSAGSFYGARCGSLLPMSDSPVLDHPQLRGEDRFVLRGRNPLEGPIGRRAPCLDAVGQVGAQDLS